MSFGGGSLGVWRGLTGLCFQDTLDFSRDLYGCLKRSEDRWSTTWKSGMLFLGFIFGPWIFLSFFGSPRNFFGFSFLPPLDHPITLHPEKPLCTLCLQFIINYDINYPLMFQTEYDSLKLHCQTLEAEHERNNQTQVTEVIPNFSVLSMPT